MDDYRRHTYLCARHPLPCDRPTNCTFGDADLRTLYVTSIAGHLIRAHYPRGTP
ncbi:MAG: hypothetical protein DCC55_24590 [Chloroflexi bacterium]|nr:MAG: hypothetical protein DCC55_24590 [Chloroflexota bacterium]